MIIYSIYKIVNTINGKVYIGMTRKQRDKRFKEHISLSKTSKPQILIQQKIKQYGQNSFNFSIIFQTKDVEHAKKMESHFISEYNCIVPNGYNIHTGGNYCYTFTTSDKVKIRMRTNNPGCTEKALKEKTSTIQAKNMITNQTFIVENRKTFAENNKIPYSSIGWAIQNNKILKNEWQFTYLKRRIIGP